MTLISFVISEELHEMIFQAFQATNNLAISSDD